MNEVKQIQQQDIIHVNFHVTQANELIRSISNLSLNENKIIFAIIAQILQTDKEIPYYSITNNQIVELCNLDKNNIKKTMKKIEKEIKDKRFIIRDEIIETTTGKIQTNVSHPWVDGFAKIDGAWHIQLNSSLKPYLINLKSNFTSESLKASVVYKNLLAFKLSLLFSMEFDKKTSKMSDQKKLDYSLRLNFLLDELKQLSLTEGKYPLYANFKQRVLKEALDEINEREQYKVTFDENKKKSKVTDITFFVKLNKNNERYIKIKEREDNEKIKEFIENNHDIANELKKRFDYNEEDFKDIYNFSRKQIIFVLKDLKENLTRKKMSNDEVKSFVRTELLQFINKKEKESTSDSFWDNL